MTSLLIALYLIAIVTANLLIVWFGPAISIVNAFAFIGLDLVTRDYLHESWRGRGLRWKMLALIGVGSALSYWLNKDAGPIALASFAAFFLAGCADAWVYSLLSKRSWKERVNWSNMAGAFFDSLTFPLLAFGWPPLVGVMLGQFTAKVAGGFVWSLILGLLLRQPNKRMKLTPQAGRLSKSADAL